MMHYIDDVPGRTAVINQKEFLFFSGYSYLGLNKIPEFTETIKTGIEKYGAVFPSSRNSNSRLHLYNEFEEALSGIFGTESTVSYSSGFLAGKAIAGLMFEQQKNYVAPNTHPAVNVGSERSSENFEEWSTFVTKEINSSSLSECCIIADAINIMESRMYEFSWLKSIRKDSRVTCIIDNSHGAGITNDIFLASLPVQQNIEYVISYSLSKAYNIAGGAVSCSKEISDQLRMRPEYSGSTAISPAMMFAFMQHQKLYQEQLEKLKTNIEYLRKRILHMNNVSAHPVLPIFIVNDPDAAEELFTKNILISSFRYPMSTSPLVNRVIVNALHIEGDLEYLADCLAQCC